MKRKVTDPVPAYWPADPYPIAFVGEAPGEEEAFAGAPFVGRSGWLIRAMCRDANIPINHCLITNSFDTRPVENNVKLFFLNKTEYKKWRGENANAELRGHGGYGYIRPDHVYNTDRLAAELREYKPRIIVALGGTAMWVLTGEHKITEYRGTITRASELGLDIPVIPTFHPAAVLRQWELRPTVVMDLIKARLVAEGMSTSPPERELWINPTLTEVLEFVDTYVKPSPIIGVDIETHWVERLIRCIGISPDPHHCLVIPLIHTFNEKNSYSYWKPEEELVVRKILALILEDTTKKKLFHNAAYDVQWLANEGMYTRGEIEDTMILHHALQPELPKKLGFLGSIYTNEIAWKHMANFREGNKKDS